MGVHTTFEKKNNNTHMVYNTVVKLLPNHVVYTFKKIIWQMTQVNYIEV